MADWYINLFFNKFREIKSQGHLVIFCVHPANAAHLELMRMICDEYIFVQNGAFRRLPGFDALLANQHIPDYLGPVVNRNTLSKI